MNSQYQTSGVSSKAMGQVIDEMDNAAERTRKKHERRWYDNNFFDDGHHFRYVNRQNNKIINWAEQSNIYNPLRAIPKASRQIRGVVNLLVSNDFVPVVYPEEIEPTNYQTKEEFELALKTAEIIARSSGHWLREEIKKQDLTNKLSYLGLLAAKGSVAFLKVYPDPIREEIITEYRDSFDLKLLGHMTDVQDLPFIIDTESRSIAEIKADERFPEEETAKLTADNRYASSEVKEAYMRVRFGSKNQMDSMATLIQKEAFIKEYLNEENETAIKKQEDGGEILKKRNKGDVVLRQTFSAGGVTLLDQYIDMTKYPYADFRFEEGPLYQTPLIERFIPQNKSLDMIVSRIERYAHTMGVGVYQKRKGENYKITNKAGGQIIEYDQTPLKQMDLAQLPPMYFNFISLLNSFIEEQGVSLTTLGKIPAGVKAARAIESLKESEYANLVMANGMLKKTIKQISELLLDYADDYFITPKQYTYMEKGEPQYLNVIGASALKKRKELKIDTREDVVPLSKELKVDVEVQSGLAYTREGKKESAKELGDYLIQLAQLNLLPPNMMVEYLDKLFEAYQFGVSSEVMQELKAFNEQGQMTNPQSDAIKLAVAEVLKDAGLPEIIQKIRELPDQNERIEEGKVATAETIKDAGLADGKADNEKQPSKSIPYKELPPEGKAQLAQQAGINISADEIRRNEAQEAMKTVIQDKGRQTK